LAFTFERVRFNGSGIFGPTTRIFCNFIDHGEQTWRLMENRMVPYLPNARAVPGVSSQ
jgi:hypothetical protein